MAILILESGVRPGEAVGLRWADVRLQTAVHARYGYIVIRAGKSRNAKRNLRLTARAAEMLKARKSQTSSEWVFTGDGAAAPILGTSLDHQHADVRTALKLSADFVIHSLRHTMLTRLGEAGAEAFAIMKIAGHSSVTVSQRYVHPTPAGMEERAFERLENLNRAKFQEAEAEAKEAAGGSRIPAISTTVKKGQSTKSLQFVDNKSAGP